MTTDFFIKRRLRYFFSAVLFSMVVAFSMYANSYTRARFVWVGKTFYFLVSTDTHIQSATHTMRLDGGAGYLLVNAERSYTAYSVYLTADIAQAVQAGMQEETLLVEKRVEYLAFRGKDKKCADLYCGALNALYGCVDVLSQTISLLENGAVQQTCKRILQILENQFGYMATQYHAQYPALASVCETLRSGINELSANIVFCNDLRYLLCYACDKYVCMSSFLSI